ncbi:PEPxxWA-CTERM sorting domain-containing protein [Sphingomonas natans]
MRHSRSARIMATRTRHRTGWKVPQASRSSASSIRRPASARCSEISALDLAALDAIGWNVDFSVLDDPAYRVSTAQLAAQAADVPEPASWALMILGFGAAGCVMRRRRAGERAPG